MKLNVQLWAALAAAHAGCVCPRLGGPQFMMTRDPRSNHLPGPGPSGAGEVMALIVGTERSGSVVWAITDPSQVILAVSFMEEEASSILF